MELIFSKLTGKFIHERETNEPASSWSSCLMKHNHTGAKREENKGKKYFTDCIPTKSCMSKLLASMCWHLPGPRMGTWVSEQDERSPQLVKQHSYVVVTLGAMISPPHQTPGQLQDSPHQASQVQHLVALLQPA